MTKAFRIHETGGPEVLILETVEVGRPGAGEVRLRHTAIGLNFIESGAVRIEIGRTWPLAAAPEAHMALEGRVTTGSTLLIP